MNSYLYLVANPATRRDPSGSSHAPGPCIPEDTQAPPLTWRNIPIKCPGYRKAMYFVGFECTTDPSSYINLTIYPACVKDHPGCQGAAVAIPAQQQAANQKTCPRLTALEQLSGLSFTFCPPGSAVCPGQWAVFGRCYCAWYCDPVANGMVPVPAPEPGVG